MALVAQEKLPAQRRLIAATIAKMFLERDRRLSSRERSVVAEVIRPLIRDIELRIRQQLAETFATHEDAENISHELFVALANDEIEVAYPILKNSPILSDPDLIDVINKRSNAHRLAIAERGSLSDAVTAALLDSGEANVIETRANNRAAALSPEMMERMLRLSQRIEQIQPPLLQRGDMPPQLAYRMFWWVTSALRHYILEHHKVDKAVLDDVLQHVAERALVMRGRSDDDGDELGAKVAALAKSGRLTESFLLETYRKGDIRLFEAALANLTAISPGTARRIVFETTGQALAIACRAAYMTRAGFSTLFMLTRKMSRGSRVNDPKDLLEALNFYDALATDRARAVLTVWNLDD